MDFEKLVTVVIGVCICTLVLTVGSCIGYTNGKIIAAPDPIAAACAVSGNVSSACVVANRKP